MKLKRLNINTCSNKCMAWKCVIVELPVTTRVIIVKNIYKCDTHLMMRMYVNCKNIMIYIAAKSLIIILESSRLHYRLLHLGRS